MVSLRLTIRQLLVFIFANAICLSLALHIEYPNRDLTARPHTLQHGVTSALSNIFRRADDDEEADYDSPPCPKSCAPKVNFINAAGKRSVPEPILREYNMSHLDERQMTLPDTDMNAFMRDEVPNSQSVAWSMPNGEDMNTSIYKPYRRKAISLGTFGLCGCTSLFIISRTGVYASHWWESISFSPEDYWRRVRSETNMAVFTRTVINPLSAGSSTSSGTPMQVALSADKFDEDVRAYLVHPEMDCRGRLDGYRSRWNKIKVEVGNIIPNLNPSTHPDRWAEPVYIRLDRDDNLLTKTAAGHVLFKFDPDHNGKKKAALWVEHNPTPVHDDEW